MKGKVIAFVAPTRSGKSYLTRKLSMHFGVPALFEVNGSLPARIQESLRTGVRQWERHLYFRGRAIDMYVQAQELTTKHPYVFLDTSWVNCLPYVDVYAIDDFARSLLTELSELDLKTLPWPDAVIVLREDDTTSERLWRLSGQGFELDEEYFRSQLLVIKHSFERFIEATPLPVPAIHIERSGIDYDDPDAFARLLESLKPIL